MEKDQMDLNNQKIQMIEQIKTMDRKQMFTEKPKSKKTLFEKILMILGYDKKR